MNNRLNKHKYPGAKRLMLEAQELKDKTEDYCAQPIDDNLFEWHFTVRGPPETAFEGGYYHGRLSFPTEYPMKPPSIILLTPNGRFTTNKKICLSISGYHPETWQPSWSVRTALLALIAFMPTKSNRAIGSLDFSDDERRKLAAKSRTWTCETCGPIKDLLKHPKDPKEHDTTEEAGAPTVTSIATNAIRADSASQNTGSLRQGDNNRDTTKDSQIRSADDSYEGRSSDSIVFNSTTDARIHLDHKKQSLGMGSDVCGERDTGSRESSSYSNQGTPTTSYLPQTDVSCSISSRPDNRRPFPALVYASIFILLFLLVLRRVVMLLQS